MSSYDQEVDKTWPLNDFQAMLYRIQKYYPSNASYNLSTLINITDLSTPNAGITTALEILFSIYPIIGCEFDRTNMCYVKSTANTLINNIVEISTFLKEDDLKEYADSLGQKPFKLNKRAPFILYYINSHESNYLLVVSHHILLDYISFNAVVDDVIKVVSGSKDYIVRSDRDISYRNMTDINYPESSGIQTHYIPHGNCEYKKTPAVFKSLCFDLSEKKYGLLKKSPILIKSTLPIMISSVLYVSLRRIMSKETIPFIFPLDARSIVGGEQYDMGCFINSMPAIISFRNTTIDTIMDAMARMYFDFLKAITYPTSEIFKSKQCLSNAIIFNYILDASNTGDFNRFIANRDQTLTVGESKVSIIGMRQQFGQSDLHVNTFDNHKKTVFEIKYNSEVYSDRTIEALKYSISKILLKVIYDSHELQNTKIDDLTIANDLGKYELFTTKQKEQYALSFAKGDAYKLSDDSILSYIAKTSANTPKKTAIYDMNTGASITYQQLNNITNIIALNLEAITSPRDIVALYMKPSIDRVLVIVGMIKAECIFLPLALDDAYERLRYVINDSCVTTVIRNTGVAFDLFDDLSDISYNSLTTIIGSGERKIIEETNSSEIYLMYTSGTTGRPKGVMSTKRGLLNRLLWMKSYLHTDETDVFIQKTPYNFDVSIWEMILPLMSGSKLIIPRISSLRDNSLLHQDMLDQCITISHFVPSLLQQYINTQDISLLPDLRCIVSSGESLHQLAVDKVHSYGIELHNLYGPTEASIDVTCWNTCDPSFGYANSVPIGYPIWNTDLYVLDRDQRLLGVSEVGELHIGGIGLASCYNNNIDLTNERFVSVGIDNKLVRLYKTGDYCKWLANGALEYIGRVDREFKHNGQRIAPEEIERAIGYPYPNKKVVVKSSKDKNNTSCIVAFIESKIQIKDDELRNGLEKRIPRYMMPSRFIYLDKIPMLASGKIDYSNTVLEYKKQQPSNEILKEPDSSSLHESFADLWCDILEIETIDKAKGFYAHGGTSLHAMNLVFRAENELSLRISIADLLSLESFNCISARVSTNRPMYIGEQIPDRCSILASTIQKRIWTLYQNDEIYESYHIPLCFEISDTNITVDQVKESIEYIVNRKKNSKI